MESLLKPKGKSLVPWHTMKVRLASYGPRVHSQLLFFPAFASVFAWGSCSVGFHVSLLTQKQLMLILRTVKIPFRSRQAREPLSTLCSNSKTNITKHLLLKMVLPRGTWAPTHMPALVLGVNSITKSWLTWKGSRCEQPEKKSFLSTPLSRELCSLPQNLINTQR